MLFRAVYSGQLSPENLSHFYTQENSINMSGFSLYIASFHVFCMSHDQVIV